MCSVATILMNGSLLVNNWLEFHFHKHPKPSLATSSDTKCSSANYKPAAVSSFNQVISLLLFFTSKQLCLTLENSHRNAFSRLAIGSITSHCSGKEHRKSPCIRLAGLNPDWSIQIMDQSGFSRREKLYCPDVNVS